MWACTNNAVHSGYLERLCHSAIVIAQSRHPCYHVWHSGPLQRIRPIAIDKKNGLFAGSERGGRHMEVIYSLLLTAKLNGLAWL